MKRSDVREFLATGVRAINPQMPFGSGRISEWNSKMADSNTEVWWESVIEATDVEIINFVLPSDTWPIRLHIGKKDTMESLPAEYEQIIDDCDYIAQQLVRKYNTVIEGVNANLASISSLNRLPFVKKHGGLLFSGVTLSFSLNVPDTTNLC